MSENVKRAAFAFAFAFAFACSKFFKRKVHTFLLSLLSLPSLFSLSYQSKNPIMSGEEEASKAKVAPGHRSLFSRVSTFGSDLVNALGDGIN